MKMATLLLLLSPMIVAAGESLPSLSLAAEDTPAALSPWTPVKGFTAHGGDWWVESGVVSIGGGSGPKLLCDASPFETGEVGVSIFLPDRRGGNAGLIYRTRHGIQNSCPNEV